MSARLLYVYVGYYFTLAMFGAFGLALSLCALLAGILPDSRRTERFFQRRVHDCFALFIWWTTFSRLFVVRYHGFEALAREEERGLVIVANHPCLTDVTCLLARLPTAVCIFKRALRGNPVLGAGARRAGYLSNAGGHDVIRAAAAKVAEGNRLLVFPEGTRTPPDGHPHPFRPGYLLIVRRARVPLQLVRIVNPRPVLGKATTWWWFPPLPGRADIFVGPRLELGPGSDLTAANEEIEAWFRQSGNAACAPWSGRLCSPLPLHAA